jgi:hypothetical protein
MLTKTKKPKQITFKLIGNELTVIVSTDKMKVRSTLEVKGEKDGSVVINANAINDFIKKNHFITMKT